MQMKLQIAPSILAADFGHLAAQVAEAEAGGGDRIHCDVMDGHFVPNISFGPDIVRRVRDLTALPVDTHLMISNPDVYIDAFAAAGSHILSVHYEACPHLHRTISAIRDAGMAAGVAINPHTPASALQSILPYVDQVIVMTVNPGFGGQKFISGMLSKIRDLRAMAPQLDVEVDGGVGSDNAADLKASGANILVAGSSVFGEPDIAAAIGNIREAALSRDRV